MGGVKLLQSIVLAMTCVGSWAFLPPTTEDVGFNVVLGESGDYGMLFTDYGRVSGRWNRHRDGSFDLLEGGVRVATIKNCDETSGILELLPEDGGEVRQFNVNRHTGSFVEAATARGFFPKHHVEEERASHIQWRDRVFARWEVNRINSRNGGEPFCEAGLRDGSFYIRSMSAGFSFSATIKTPMSRLKATTSDYNVSIGLVFDGDVALMVDGSRLRKSLGGLFDNGANALRYLSVADQVAVFDTYDFVGRYDLAGSAEAIEALKACPL